MRAPVLPTPSRNFWRGIFRAGLLATLFWLGVAWAMPGCSPRSLREVNKQAPDPPYAGQYHGGLDRAQYLRDTEPLNYE